ncbi:hypothetical protein N9B49_01340 [bacterium]|nr:hypothetical protein [bacterium]
MKNSSRSVLALFVVFGSLLPRGVGAASEPVRISTPMSPPEWALLQRQVLAASSDAIAEFYDYFYDERGYLLHIPRWGTLDGTDDAIENSKYWTILHALGASDEVLDITEHELNGSFRQYTEVKTTSTDVAEEGSYYKEFMPMSDFMHQGEGYQGLIHQGLSDPSDPLMRKRYKRFAGFYLNEDPDALNYDPEHKMLRSFWTGSKGPMLREGTVYDWAGDKTPGKFHLLHHKNGGSSMFDYEAVYAETLHHFYFFPQSTAGDHALNLASTQLALNAYMLDHEKKYRDWLVEYADAWVERAEATGGNFPSNVGLDGKIGTAIADKWYMDQESEKGKWYMGTYGWNFSYFDWSKGINHRNNRVFQGVWPGMGNAFLVTGDHKYVDAMRTQLDTFYAQMKEIDGVKMLPTHYGIHIDRDHPRKFDVFDIVDEKLDVPDGQGVEGWYNWTRNLYTSEAIDVFLFSMDAKDRERVKHDQWIRFLDGDNPAYPAQALRRQLEFIRQIMERMRQEPTTPETRLADWPLRYNPAKVHDLVRLMWGGNMSGRIWTMHTRVRYFDPSNDRAGLPPDVGALVTGIEGETTTVQLVNTNPLESRKVVVQTGAYGEHECRFVKVGGEEFPVNARHFTVDLDPGAGAEIVITAQRYANKPTFAFPW